MSYSVFLLLFVVPPAILLTAWARPARRDWLMIAALAVITYAWTTPWDNYLVGSGVWFYEPRLVSGVTLGWVPLEEYLFFGLQVWLSGMWCLSLRRVFIDRPVRAAVGAADLTLLAAPLGLWFTAWRMPSAPAGLPAAAWPSLPWGHANYLILILAWALPVIVGQWLLGGDVFRAHWKVWWLGWLVPAVYLTAIDSIALGAGTWTIAPAQSLNFFLPGQVPLEEGLFFLVTNLLIVQGLLLFTSPIMRRRVLGRLGR